MKHSKMGSFHPILLLAILQALTASVTGTKNVLFLVADDLRPQLGAYLGADFPASIYPDMITPNLDKLASKSFLAKRAYTQYALCAPSRSSFLTARRPDTTHVYDVQTYFRESGGNFTTLPQYFKEHDYKVMGLGKIFHSSDGGEDDPLSWTEPYYHAPNNGYWNNRINDSWAAIPEADRLAMPLPEDQLANETINRLRELDLTGEPFFMAVGMYKPHLSFVFPEEYLAYYPPGSVRLPDNLYAPVNMPEIAWYNWEELRRYSDIAALNVTGEFNTTLPDNVTMYMRRAYYATVSYVDDMLGRILDELDSLSIANNTIISMVGDHGWQLGEHAEYCKHTVFELATLVPMMFRIPGLTDHGIITDELVELVDLYPTILDAAGLSQLPLCAKNTSTTTEACREGESFMPLVYNNTGITWKDRAFSQFYREDNQTMGYSIRTDNYRYTEWVHFSGEPDYEPNWNIVRGLELYDHNINPYENVNFAYHPDYQDIVDLLSEELHGGWWAMV